MKNVLAFISFSLLVTANSFGQGSVTPTSPTDAYTKTINARAQKIIATLGISDSAKAWRVQTIIANQYRNLNVLHADRDSQLNAIKAKPDAKDVTDVAGKKAQDDASFRIKKAHDEFVSSLSSELTADQIEKVKDGMTYNVVNITYAGYLDMLPNLTAEQKKQIRTWLEEAREHAMDAETSEKKHAWFGKYKGRINNYLSAAGYDLRTEGDAWQQRLKEREEKKKTANQ